MHFNHFFVDLPVGKFFILIVEDIFLKRVKQIFIDLCLICDSIVAKCRKDFGEKKVAVKNGYLEFQRVSTHF